MTEDHARYDRRRPDRRPQQPERIGDILRRLADQEGWNQHLPPANTHGHRPADPVTNGRHHG